MRQIGSLAAEDQATRFIDFLLTQGIKAQRESDNGAWTIWVYDEDKVAAARGLFDRYREKPDDPQYGDAIETARRLRDEHIRREAQIRRNIVDVRSQWRTASMASRPLTFVLLVMSIAVGVLTKLGDDRGDDSLLDDLLISRTVPERLPGPFPRFRLLGPESDIRRGQVWRLVTPIFIHFGMLHLLFNMMWLHSLGGVIETRLGTLRLALLVLFVAIASNLAQFWWSGPAFGGMSGVVFGLFGYLWIRGRYDPTAGMAIDSGNVFLMMLWLVVCMTGAIGRVANAAHLVGLLAGVLMAIVHNALRLRRRR